MIEKEKKTARAQPAKAAPTPDQTGVNTPPEDGLTLALKGFVAHRRDEAMQKVRARIRSKFEGELRQARKGVASARKQAKNTGSSDTK